MNQGLNISLEQLIILLLLLRNQKIQFQVSKNCQSFHVILHFDCCKIMTVPNMLLLGGKDPRPQSIRSLEFEKCRIYFSPRGLCFPSYYGQREAQTTVLFNTLTSSMKALL